MTRLDDHQLLRPTSRPGRWSIGLFVMFVLGQLTLAVALTSQPGRDPLTGGWLLAAGAVAVAIAAFASLATAVYAIARYERSVLVIGCTVIGSLVTLVVLC